MSQPNRPSSAKLAKLAVLGFLVGSLHERSARASVLYYALTFGLISGVTSSGVVTSAGVVVLVVWVAQQSDKDGDVPEGHTSRMLIDSAIVSHRGDLGVQVQLLTESPTAFAQLDREMSLGEGPALDALARSTQLPIPRLQAAWAAAKAPVGLVDAPEDASRVVFGLLVELSPELSPSRDASAELAWALARERSLPHFPEGARTHAWLAEWMGVSVEAVGEASQAALASLPGLADQEPRPFIYANPDAYLDALCVSLERSEREAIDARVASIAQDAAAILPPELRQSLLASAAP